MPTVRFSHPGLDDDLTIVTGADQIEWGYGLNFSTYPTYGGEVVQILSAYIDDLTISGTVRTVAKMEQIYLWFLRYFQTASQGVALKDLTDDPTDPASYNEIPVTFTYPERDWKMLIYPVSLPGYRIATDQVAPQWQIQCRVLEDDPKIQQLTMATAADALTDTTNALQQFGRLNAAFGTGDPASNPFSDPQPGVDKFSAAVAAGSLKQVGDYYTSLLTSYENKDFSSLFGSQPTDNQASITSGSSESSTQSSKSPPSTAP